MRGLLAALLCTTAISAAQGAGWGGYKYSCSDAGVFCDGVRVTFIEPAGYAGTIGEDKDSAFAWVGIQGDAGQGGAQCTNGSGTNNPLLQFGTAPTQFANGTQTHQTWWEAAPCNNVQNFGSLVVNAGDSVSLEQLCTANCTAGNASAVWQFTWTNNTTAVSPQVTTVTGWNVYGDNAIAVIEGTSAGVDNTGFQPLHFGRMKFSGMQVHYSGAWHTVPISGVKSPWFLEHEWQEISASPGPNTLSLYGPSPPIGPLGNDFYACELIAAQVSTASPLCPASAYTSSNGIGP